MCITQLCDQLRQTYYGKDKKGAAAASGDDQDNLRKRRYEGERCACLCVQVTCVVTDCACI
jgi:hypothetical protein